MSEQELVLSVRHVTSGYRNRGVFRRGPYQEVLHDVTFDVRHGEILGLVGESGTGKSTLAKTILGIVKPDQGQVIHYTKRPQMIFQDPYSALNPAYSVAWTLEEPCGSSANTTRRSASAGSGRCWTGWACRRSVWRPSRRSSPAASGSGCPLPWR